MEKLNSKRMSLHPLHYREALRDLLKVKPEPKPPKKLAKVKAKPTASKGKAKYGT